MKKLTWIATTVIVVCMAWMPTEVVAQKVDCKNEYRSGKLYFQQYRDAKRKESPKSRLSIGEGTMVLLEKAMQRYGIAVENCPLADAEFRWNNGIALGEAAMIALENAVVTPMADEKAALQDKAFDYISKASDEFSAVPDTKNGEKKKQLKMARENRLYFWTELYNHGLERAKEDDLEAAGAYMEAAIIMDPRDARTYRQGAIVLFNAGRKADAADLVKRGLELEIDPTDEVNTKIFNENKPKLEELQLALFSELGREASKQAKDNKDMELLRKALGYYDVLVGAQPENPNHIYGRGLAHMNGGKISKESDPEGCIALFRAAGEDLTKASEMVTVEKDAGFHASAVRAAMYAFRDAGDDERAFELNLKYTCLEPLKAAAWRGLARTFVAQGNQDMGVGALMMSKSLGGTDVPVNIATENATDDAKAGVAELGAPSTVKTYQDGESSVMTFIWEEKKIARHYILGKIQQEITWCE